MPVFDFSGSDNKNKNIVTYETFQSSERTATAEKPIMLLENSTRKWAHHSSGKFTNPIKRTAFEFDEVDGVQSADILKIDARFVSLLKWLGENHINVRLSGENRPEGYAVYKIRETEFGGGAKLSANDGFLQFMIERLLASDAPSEDEKSEEEEEEEDDAIKVAVIGKPNAGKSSLVNKILGEERVIVSNVAGTTRDAIDSYFENETGKYCFIDTAGMRRKSKVDDAIEKYSNMRSISAIDRADVCLILVDANDGVTEQDTKIAGLVHEAGKAAIIVVNKWDAVEDKETNTMRDMEAKVRSGLSYMLYAPVLFISALTGARVDKLFQLIQDVHAQNTMRITTGALNSVLADATARVQPPTDKGRRLKIYYMTQASTKPPHFVIFCNDARLFHFSYQRYLENQIREVFGLQGTPVRITIRQKGDKEEQ